MKRETVRIVVLAGKTFRGIYHFEEVKYDASTELAAHAIREGVARLAALDPRKETK